MVKESTKPSNISGVVEGVQVKTGRPLPLLRDKRKYAGIEEVLQRDFSARIQMDKPAESEEEFHLCPIL